MQDVPLAGKWNRQSFCAQWTAGLNPTVMGFKFSGPPLVIISLLNLEVSSNFNVHLSLWEHIRLSADPVMSVPLKLYNPCGVYRNWNEGKQQSFQNNFPETLVKPLLLTRLSPATLASKTPLRQHLPYRHSALNSSTSDRLSSLYVTSCKKQFPEALFPQEYFHRPQEALAQATLDQEG